MFCECPYEFVGILVIVPSYGKKVNNLVIF